MTEPLRILILEDNPADAELVQFELEDAGIAFTATVVSTEKDFVRELQECSFDLILSDYDLPRYNGTLALEESKKRCPDIRFVLVTGAVSEDRAIQILTNGAKDYVMKSRLGQRLAPAVRRVLAEAEEIRARKRAEEELRKACAELEDRVKERTAALEAEIAQRKRTEEALDRQRAFLESLIANAGSCIAVVQGRELRYTVANPAFQALAGDVPMVGRTYREVFPEAAQAGAEAQMRRVLETGETWELKDYMAPIPGVPDATWQGHVVRLPAVEGEEPSALAVVWNVTERKRADEALRLTQASIDGAAEMVAWFRPDGSVHYVNDATCRTLGYSREELLKMNALDFSPGFTREQYEEHWKEVRARKSFTLQPVHRRKDGSTYTAEVLVNHVAYGGQEFILAYGRDITERKQAEAALRENAERQRALEAAVAERQRFLDVLETLPAMICLLTPDHHVAFANRSFREKFGESQGRHCYEYCFGLSEPCEFCESYQVLKTGKSHHWEVKTPDGSVIDAYDFPFTDVDGSPMILEMDVDITAYRRTEEALKAERQRFRDVLDVLPAYVILLTPDYYVPFANRFFEERFGKAEGRCFEYLFGRTEPCEICETYSVLKTRQRHEWEWTGPDGRDYHIFDFPFTDADGADFILEMGLDITESKKTAAELTMHRDHLEELVEERTRKMEAACKELESFSYSISHDLRAPLRAIDGYARMILKKQEYNFDEDTKRQFTQIRDGVKAMGQLIDDLLALSKSSSQELIVRNQDIGQLIEKTWDELQKANADRKMTLKLNRPLPPALVDKGLIQQVIVNILTNAVKFTRNRDAALIEAGGFERNHEVVYYVKDNGVGFDMQYHDKLFGVFQRLHSADEYEGTGIGMALVQRIIHRHGGRVWAEAEVDKGATFYFILPKQHE